MAAQFIIRRGETFEYVIRWGSSPVKFVPITAITQTAPANVTAAAHGIPDGWPCAITSVKGMRQINADNDPPRPRDYLAATVADADTLQFEVDASAFSPYVSGGYVRCMTPVDLTGYTARLAFKDKAGGVELLRLTTENGGIAIDNSEKKITLRIAASVTTAIEWDRALFDLEMVKDSGGVEHVRRILSDIALVDPNGREITT